MELPFTDPVFRLPDGFMYEPAFLSETEEEQIRIRLQQIPLSPFLFHGFTAKRLVKSFGLKYDFAGRTLERAESPPAFIRILANRIHRHFHLQEPIMQMQVTRYDPGANINWHRDAPLFESIMGLSFLSPCRFRLRRMNAEQPEIVELKVLPGSLYRLSGEVRENWEHSTMPQQFSRYSLTFRTLRPGYVASAGLV